MEVTARSHRLQEVSPVTNNQTQGKGAAPNKLKADMTSKRAAFPRVAGIGPERILLLKFLSHGARMKKKTTKTQRRNEKITYKNFKAGRFPRDAGMAPEIAPREAKVLEQRAREVQRLPVRTHTHSRVNP